MAASGSELVVQSGEESSLRSGVRGRDEDRVVARQRSDGLRPVGTVEDDGDALCAACGRADHRDGRELADVVPGWRDDTAYDVGGERELEAEEEPDPEAHEEFFTPACW